jgi:hypothetical protein
VIHAYFLGGPWDLTKRAIPEGYGPLYYVPHMQWPQPTRDYDPDALVITAKHVYELKYVDSRRNSADTCVYIYRGIE